MSGNENSFTHDGVEYVAVDGDDCVNCCFGFPFCCDETMPPCVGVDRKDGREVIFKKKVD